MQLEINIITMRCARPYLYVQVDLYAPDAGSSLPRLRLRSMFAEKPEDCLMFQVNTAPSIHQFAEYLVLQAHSLFPA